jgi:hypothetical protein
MKKIFVFLLSIAIASAGFSQVSAGIKNLINTDGSLKMPKNFKEAKASIKLKYTFIEDTIMGSSHSWHNTSGVTLISTDSYGAEFIDLIIATEDRNTVVKDLPFGVFINKTTKTTALKLSKKYAGFEAPSNSYVCFKYKGLYYSLLFSEENNNKLESIKISRYKPFEAG